MNWSLDDVLVATDGILMGRRHSDEILFSFIETDTRKLEPGSVFVAIKGERFDGHDFIMEAIKKGAGAIVYSRSDITDSIHTVPGVYFVYVEDTRKALADLACFRRRKFPGPMIGVTGSNGKTSTKEMIALVLGRKYRVFKTPANWNNDIGVSLSIFQMPDDVDAVVLELGINHFGEMDQLVDVVEPTVGVITNIQPAHLEGFDSLEGVLREKTKLWQKLPNDGVAVINLDDPLLAKYAAGLTKSKITFGRSVNADVHVEGLIDLSLDGMTFSVRFGEKVVPCNLRAFGEHYVMNALCAVAVGLQLGVSLDDAVEALRAWTLVEHRMQKMELSDGTIIFDDCYNANPGSMTRAIETVAFLAEKHKRPLVLVLGDMKELGRDSENLHGKIGKIAASKNPHMVVTAGREAKAIFEEFQKGCATLSYHFDAGDGGKIDHSMIAQWLQKNWIAGAIFLFKASRAMEFEKVIDQIMQWKPR